MFYISRNIQTEVFFTHQQMDQLSTDVEIVKRLKNKVQGYCDEEYGYLVQVIANPSATEIGVIVEKIDIRKEGLFAKIKFSCITFRRIDFYNQASKNEVMLMVVEQIHQNFMMGKIGPASVMIPKLKMADSINFKHHDNTFEFINEEQDESLAVKIGSRIYCRCLEIRVQMDSLMRIIGSIDKSMVHLAFCKREDD